LLGLERQRGEWLIGPGCAAVRGMGMQWGRWSGRVACGGGGGGERVVFGVLVCELGLIDDLVQTCLTFQAPPAT